MIRKITLGLLIAVTHAIGSFGATYYVKPDGNDANSGLSPVQRWATVSYAVNQMINGDTLYIAGDHRITTAIRPLAGISNTHRTAYIGWDGVNASTRLQGGGMITYGDTITGSWTNHGGGVYSATSPFGLSQMGGCIINDSMMPDYGGPTASPTAGDWGQVGNTIYVNMDGSTSPAGKLTIVFPEKAIFHLNGDGSTGGSSNQWNRDYISFWGLQLKYSGLAFGLYEARDCDFWTIERCALIGASSSTPSLNTALIVLKDCGSIDSSRAPHDWVVRKCDIAFAFDPHKSGHGSAISLYDYQNFTIDSNHFYGTFSGDCVEAKGQYASQVNSANLVVAHNLMNPTDARSGVTIWNHHVNARIYGNVMIGFQEGFSGRDGYSNNRSSGARFYNNTIINMRDAHVSGYDEGTGNPFGGYDHEIKFNVFYECGSFGVKEDQDIANGVVPGNHFDIDTNMYFNNDLSATFGMEYSSLSFSQWQSIGGWDINSTVDVDPGFDGIASSFDTISSWNSAANLLSRTGSSGEINRFHNGQLWTNFGAIQGAGDTSTSLVLTPSSLYDTVEQNSPLPPSQIFNISNGGVGVLNWSLANNTTWLDILSPTSGNGNSNDIAVRVNRSDLSVGIHVGTITIHSSNAVNNPQSLTYFYNIESSIPQIAVNPSSLSFSAVADGSLPAPVDLIITNTGGGTLDYTINNLPNWVYIDPAQLSGISNEDTIQVSVTTTDTTVLSAGTYNGAITINSSSADNTPLAVNVSYLLSSTAIDILQSKPWDTGLVYGVVQGNQRLLLFAVGWEDFGAGSDRPISSISYGGMPMTRIIRHTQPSHQGAELWFLKEVDMQNAVDSTFTVNWSNGQPGASIHYLSGLFEGVNQNQPYYFYNSASTDGTSNSLATTQHVESRGYSVAVATIGNSAANLVWNSGWTSFVSQSDNTAKTVIGGHLEAADDTNSVVSVIDAGNTSSRLVLISVSLAPIGPDATPPAVIQLR